MSNYYSNSRQEVIELLDFKYSNILDIGCGAGGVATYIKNIYPSVSIIGVDKFYDGSTDYTQFNSFYNIDLNLDINKLDIDYKSIDLVLLLDILEHLINPNLVLNQITKKIRSGTHLVISLPNFLHYSNLIEIVSRKSFEYKDSGILDKTHLRFFAKKNSEELIRAAGLKIINYYPHRISKSIKSRFLELILGSTYTAYQDIFICKK